MCMYLKKVKWRKPPEPHYGPPTGKVFEKVREKNGSKFVTAKKSRCPNGQHEDEHCEVCAASGSYYARGCRCDMCRAMHSARVRKARARRTKMLEKDPTLARHGYPGTYRNWGCRCSACTAAHSAACTLYQMKRKAG